MSRIRASMLLAFLLAAACARIVPPAGARPAVPASVRPNVLFIAVDDLNHWVRVLGRNRQVLTPNIDRLASRGVSFAHAYTAAPVCSPSRAALMSGLRPSTSGVYENGTDWRQAIPESLTLPTHFRKHGYWVGGAGKIYHGIHPRRSEWDDYMDDAEATDPCHPEGAAGVGGIAFAPVDCRDDQMPDYRVTSWVVEQLRHRRDRPVFLACGLSKPHLPWYVPRRYYDRYPLSRVQLPPVPDGDLDDVPPEGVRLAGPNGDHAAILRSGRWKEAVRAYMAAISFADANVGRLLDALERGPYRHDTIVVLWSDHGWHLGEKGHWRKFTLWEEATRVPLIWVAPGVTQPGTVCRRPVDLMSVYPTLAELCGLPVPSHVEGRSIRTLLANPDAAWPDAAVSTYLFRNHAVRTDQWRYIRYHDGTEELYDEARDPWEWTNLAGRPGLSRVKAELAGYLPKVDKPAPDPPGPDDEREGEDPADR